AAATHRRRLAWPACGWNNQALSRTILRHWRHTRPMTAHPTPNPEYLARLRSGIGRAPFPNLIGLELAEIDFDSCRIDLVLSEKHLQPFGIVHGGVLASLIDTATFWAAFLRLPE